MCYMITNECQTLDCWKPGWTCVKKKDKNQVFEIKLEKSKYIATIIVNYAYVGKDKGLK